jgi:hypothetical protein
MGYDQILRLILDVGTDTFVILFIVYLVVEKYLPDYMKMHWSKVIMDLKSKVELTGRKEYEIFRQSVERQKEFIDWINSFNQYSQPLQPHEKLKINQEYQLFLTKLPDPILNALHEQLKKGNGTIADKKPIWIAMRKVCFPNTQLQPLDLYEW